MRDQIGSVLGGALAFATLLGGYLAVLSLLSGWSATISQFAEFWPYVITLALGFGLQVGLYLHLRRMSAEHHHARHMVAASGTTSTAAMLACCTHYLVNVLPVLGAVGVISFVAEYQTQLLWIGLAFNAAGIVFIGHRVWMAKREFLGSRAC